MERRSRSSWRRKFAVALAGVGVAIRGESSFCVHLFAAAASLLALAALDSNAGEWAAVLLAIGLVFVAELVNTSIEILFRGFDQPTRDRVYPALDVSAGAVLVASICAVAVGVAVFGPKLWTLVG